MHCGETAGRINLPFGCRPVLWLSDGACGVKLAWPRLPLANAYTLMYIVQTVYTGCTCAATWRVYLQREDFFTKFVFANVLPSSCYAPARRKGQVSVAFVCPSVAYIPNNSRTQRPNVPKFRMKVPHLWCDSHTSFKVKRWKVKVTRIINANHWLNCDADTSAAYLPTATYRITLVGVFLGHFCISLHQTRTQNSNEGPQHCNGAQFWKIAV